MPGYLIRKARLLTALILSAGCLLLLVSCQQQKEYTSQFAALDTYITLKIYADDDSVLADAESEIKKIEELISVTKETSEIRRLNETGQISASELTADLVTKAIRMCDETDGAVNIAIYPLVKAWGFTTDNHQVPEKDIIEKLLNNIDYHEITVDGNTISLNDGMMIDLGSIAKGYISDHLCQMFQANGISSAIIDLGGNIQTLGKKPDGSPWRIGIQSPESADIIGVLESAGEAVITSGGYQRFFEDDEGNIWWHILDPSTGYSARNGLISVTVVGPEGYKCDALSTALFVMGTDKAIDFWKTNGGFEMILVSDDNRIYITPDLHKRFTPEENCAMEMKVISDD